MAMCACWPHQQVAGRPATTSKQIQAWATCTLPAGSRRPQKFPILPKVAKIYPLLDHFATIRASHQEQQLHVLHHIHTQDVSSSSRLPVDSTCGQENRTETPFLWPTSQYCCLRGTQHRVSATQGIGRSSAKTHPHHLQDSVANSLRHTIALRPIAQHGASDSNL